MKLSPAEVALYYKLMWPLQFYVNQKLNILPDVDSLEVYVEYYDSEDKLPVRNALYENPKLIEAFISENPAPLSEAELAIVQSWKNFVAGDFYVDRFLKKGAIFITAGEPSPVYVVLGLTDSLKDFFSTVSVRPSWSKRFCFHSRAVLSMMVCFNFIAYFLAAVSKAI